jgi:hypothetical protein
VFDIQFDQTALNILYIMHDFRPIRV